MLQQNRVVRILKNSSVDFFNRLGRFIGQAKYGIFVPITIRKLLLSEPIMYDVERAYQGSGVDNS